MTIFFISLAALAFIHFVYEGILAPSLRAKLRLEIFTLRDNLRDLKIKRGTELSDEVFRELQSSMNGAVARLNQIDLRLLRIARQEIERDEELRKRVARHMAILDECPLEEVHIIRGKYFELLDRVLMVNSGGWIPYLVPIAFGYIFADTAKSLIKTVFSLPENDLNRIAPPPPAFA